VVTRHDLSPPFLGPRKQRIRFNRFTSLNFELAPSEIISFMMDTIGLGGVADLGGSIDLQVPLYGPNQRVEIRIHKMIFVLFFGKFKIDSVTICDGEGHVPVPSI
jgi:hypothetical protein